MIVITFLQQPKFGKHPTGERLKKIEQSPNFKNGSFQNVSHTPGLTEGVSYYTVFKKFFFEKKGKSLTLTFTNFFIIK